MTISHRKINQLIEDAVNDFNAFGYNTVKFEQLCKKIYMMESSLNDSVSSTRLIQDIRDEIVQRGQSFKEDKK